MSARPEPAANPPRSRRALLAGALGGLAAWAASTAVRVSPAEAAAGDPIRMGRLNRAAGATTTIQTTSSQPVFRAVQSGGGNGLRGEATNGRGVVGTAGTNGTGLWGYSPNHNGVFARTDTGVSVFAYAAGSRSTGLYSQIGAQGAVAIHAEGPTELYGRVYVHGQLSTPQPIVLYETGSPSPPTSSQAKLFARDNGSGKTQLCVRFATGAVQVIATEQ